MGSNLRDVLDDLDALMVKRASAGASAPTSKAVKDDSRDLEKSANVAKMANSLQATLDGMLSKLAEDEESKEDKAEEKKEDKAEEKKEEGENKEEGVKKEMPAFMKEKKDGEDKKEEGSEKTSSYNYTQEDLTMLQKLASTGALQAFTKEQLLDYELSKEAGYNLALETVADIISKVGGQLTKTASVAGYHAAIDQVVEAGHMQVCDADMNLLKSAADTQIAASYLDTLVSQNLLTAEGRAVILNSLAQAPEINEESIAAAVAGLSPEQAAQAHQALMDQFVQRNTAAVPAGQPMQPVTQPQAAAAGSAVAPELASAPVAPRPEIAHGVAPQGTGDYTKAAAWDMYAPALISEAQAFEKLAEAHPELWSMVEGHEKTASDPTEEYYNNFLRSRGYKV